MIADRHLMIQVHGAHCVCGQPHKWRGQWVSCPSTNRQEDSNGR